MPDQLDINDVLNRRSDLSTFVVHLTRNIEGGLSAKENLKAILTGRVIEARNPRGWAGGLDDGDRDCMKVVCFSETPLEHMYTLFADIAGRRVQLSPYGVAFTKRVARRRGANPIWYVDTASTTTLRDALDQMRDAAKADAGGFAGTPAAKVLPFIEQMGSWPTGTVKEFWWEREWRHLGPFRFRQPHVALVLCPAADVEEFEDLGYRAVDPTWSLERMVAHLVGLEDDAVTQFGG
jgi:hypothetical protein